VTEFEGPPTITDAQQVADLCQATIDVLVAFDRWRSSQSGVTAQPRLG